MLGHGGPHGGHGPGGHPRHPGHRPPPPPPRHRYHGHRPPPGMGCAGCLVYVLGAMALIALVIALLV